MKDFKRARYTAVASDLHLCEAEPESSLRRSSLWKKFKTKQFFFDDQFRDLLVHLCEKASPDPVELVLNGDIFDFDSFMQLPDSPPYRVSWLEKRRGLHPEETRSIFKIRKILEDHPTWVLALRDFLKTNSDNRLIFVIGNHDLDLHFVGVQEVILDAISRESEIRERVRFCAWFYISNQDTLIEHGNQYDPYCLCQDPVNPLIMQYNRAEVRIPFGNLAGRYMTNGMGFFNPHVDSNFIMPIGAYLTFFFKYMIWTQPLILWTWFWGAAATLWKAFFDRLLPAFRDPLTVEDRIEDIAQKANASARMVRELRELSAHPATSDPLLMARELWLDRALLVFLSLMGFFAIFSMVNVVYQISIFWMFIPISFFIPFFIFYFQSIDSQVHKYKEPDERTLALSGQITRVSRVIYGHTHVPRHEWIGSIEHLNCGTWSPAFHDVECTKPFGKKTFVWISPPGLDGLRRSQLFEVHFETATIDRRIKSREIQLKRYSA